MRAFTKLALSSMPKYYAVARGRDGPKIYNSWDECKENVSRYPGAVHKSFNSMEQAETWLASSLSLQTAVATQSAPRPSDSFRSQKPYSRTARLKSSAPATSVPAYASSSSNAEASTSTTVSLSEEQKSVLRQVKNGKSTFFSGSAGTGKSVLLRELIKELGGHGCPTLGITASTGIAAINIGGCTLHSWAGIGIGNEPAKKLAGMFIGQPKYDRVLERWRTVNTLIIDESAYLCLLFLSLLSPAQFLWSMAHCSTSWRRLRAWSAETMLLLVASSSFYPVCSN
ncbi:PIF1-like helicase-domain-containing protein [Mycena leptocephala]|nr:PIF1-like helicase-domain-containing protein [Mycena leptocephala]